MVRIVTGVDRPPASLVEAFSNLQTAVISDVTPGFEMVMDHEIKPVSTATEMVGTALTVRVPPGDNLTVHKALTLARPGDVLVIDAQGFTEAAIWGELTSTSAQAHDLAGTIVDGAVRDVGEIGAMGYPVYARAVCPKSPDKAVVGSINVPVTCGGRHVSPGDIVVGDREGIAVIDPEIAEEVLADGRAKLEREAELKSRAMTGEYLYDITDLASVVDEQDVAEVDLSGDSDSLTDAER